MQEWRRPACEDKPETGGACVRDQCELLDLLKVGLKNMYELAMLVVALLCMHSNKR